jgi:hypothetical protein
VLLIADFHRRPMRQGGGVRAKLPNKVWPPVRNACRRHRGKKRGIKSPPRGGDGLLVVRFHSAKSHWPYGCIGADQLYPFPTGMGLL